jgi:hypothetical protein
VQTKNRQTILLFAALAVALTFIGDHLVIEPSINAWKARSKRIVELKQLIKQGEMLQSREATIRDHWTQMRTNMLSSNESLAQSQILKAFDRWSQDSRMKVGSIKPQWKQGEEYTTLECRANATGDIQSLAKFIYDAEKDPLAVKVDSFEITSHDNNGQQLSLVLQVSGLVFTQTQ